MTSTPKAPREIGTLIVVILKAKHLPNKRHIGKQDPYCSVYHNGEKRRTKAIKRGGQHPEWDEEVRFTLYEDPEPEHVDVDGVPPPPPPKNEKGIKKIKGGTNMKLACFADDPREPDLIGETTVDLTEVLTKGETDEWFVLLNRDKYSGEVYLELTFWSNEPAPQKKTTPRVSPSNKQYGGPGSFAPLTDDPQTGLYPSQRVPSMGSGSPHGRQVSDGYPTMRTSSSLTRLDLYVAPYERRNQYKDVNQAADDFGALNIHDGRRRESLPPPTLAARPSSITRSHSPSFNDRSTTPNPTPNSISHPPVSRSARYSIPASSSGFAPLPTASSFSSVTAQLAEQQMKQAPPPLPPLPQTPHIPMYTGSQSQPSIFSSLPPPTPSIPPSSSYQPGPDIHHAYSHPPTVSAQYQPPVHQPPVHQPPVHQSPVHQSPIHPSPVHPPPIPQSAVHQPPPPQQQQQQYINYGPTPSPPREHTSYQLPAPMLMPQMTSSGSRPLPQPQGPPQVQPLGPSPSRVNVHSYSPNHSQSMAVFPTSPIPPPPPLNSGNRNGSFSEIHSGGTLSLPPPPPLPFSAGTVRQRRHSSLPQPPVNVTNHLALSPYNAIPPPPPPPPPGQLNTGLSITPSSMSFTNYYSGPPRPQLPTPPSSQYQLVQPSWRKV